MIGVGIGVGVGLLFSWRTSLVVFDSVELSPLLAASIESTCSLFSSSFSHDPNSSGITGVGKGVGVFLPLFIF